MLGSFQGSGRTTIEKSATGLTRICSAKMTIAWSQACAFLGSMTIRSRSEAASDVIQYHPEYNTDHHAPRGFKNPWIYENAPTQIERLGWVLSLPFKPRLKTPTEITQITREQIQNEKKNRAAWWIGHATVLFKLSGKYVITDPVFTEEPLQEPKEQIEQLIKDRSLDKKRIHVLPIGGYLPLK